MIYLSCRVSGRDRPLLNGEANLAVPPLLPTLPLLLVKGGIRRISEGSRISFKFNLILKRFKLVSRACGRQQKHSEKRVGTAAGRESAVSAAKVSGSGRRNAAISALLL